MFVLFVVLPKIFEPFCEISVSGYIDRDKSGRS